MLRMFLFRFGLPTVLLAAAASLVTMPVIDMLLSGWFRSDTEQRARSVARSIEEPLQSLLSADDPKALGRFLARIALNEHLMGIVVCTAHGTPWAMTASVPEGVRCRGRSELQGVPSVWVVPTAGGSVQASAFLLPTDRLGDLTVLLLQDVSFLDRHSTARDYARTFVAVAIIGLSLLFVAVVWWTVRRWAGVFLSDLRGRRFQDDAHSPAFARPILSQLRDVLREVEEVQRLEIEYQENWTPAALQHIVGEYLDFPEVLIVSNREPYVHTLDGDGVPKVHVPASGMVTALEPIVRACRGTWIAHGSGNADRLVVDRHDRLQVPTESPSYRLRRVWLTAEQEDGYYYGLANEGIWPLCHLAYVRPEFRETDWRQYVAVNELFAKVVAEETHKSSPVIFIQDYHFALLPVFIRQRLRNATIVHFWHIPWPNAETFGVCPWRSDIVAGLLRADILGFHTRYHCHNFLDAVDRYVEGQIDREHMTVTIRDHRCQIEAYPISIEWPSPWERVTRSVRECRAAVRERFGISDSVTLGIGVERWDFTKGILERIAAIEHLLEIRPDLRRRIVLLQVASPSRTRLPAYRELQQRTAARVAEVNWRFSVGDWQPVILLAEHQEPAQVFEFYRAADFCLVNSLHDGMNLVAKEFVSARDDEDGVLILSTFAGAARELVEALIVNPFDAIETAAAIEAAIKMPRGERRDRMRMMRRTVKYNNVFRWAGRMLVDAAQIRRRQRLSAQSAIARPPLLGDGL